MPIRGAYFQQSHEVMEPRRARNAINYTDCPRPLLGSGRNRYVPVASACRGSMINRYARVPAGAAERDKLTWHSYYPAAPFFGLFSQFHYYNRKVISLHRHSANGKVRLLRSCESVSYTHLDVYKRQPEEHFTLSGLQSRTQYVVFSLGKSVYRKGLLMTRHY